MIDGLPERWTLPAPESQVLLTGPETPNNWAIRLALKELVLRRVMSIRTAETRRFWVLRRQVSILVPGNHPAAQVSQPQAAVLSVLPKPTHYPDGSSGVPITSAAIEVTRWYRAGGGYVEAEVLPELRRQGLYDLYADTGGPRWRPTPRGEEALALLRELMATGREPFPQWVESDRNRASEFVRAAGPAVLLLGNPVPWIWILLMETLSGDQSIAMPWADPFTDPFAMAQQQEGSAGGDGGAGAGSDGGAPASPSRQDDDKDPADTIDREVDAASDGAGDGEGGDGE